MAKPKPHEVNSLSADHSLNNITRLSSLEYRRDTNFCTCSLPFRHKAESGSIYLIFLNTNQGSKRLKHTLFVGLFVRNNFLASRRYRIRRNEK